jgi:beta-glucosidase
MKKQISRRGFGTAVGTALGGVAFGPLPAFSAPGAAPAGYYRFPEQFVWGCATASYQVEGASAEDGRKPSVWDTFSHTPGKVYNGDTGDVANDSYHRYKDDVQLLKSLGVKAYRFSIAWPRVIPDGTGAVNEKGIAYYERLLDQLANAGIEPYATLFHWDLPQALEDRFGGWQSADTSKAFADYAELVAKRFSGRIRHFFTTNEFSCFTDDGYATGEKAPGKRLAPAQVNQVRHNAVLAHGLGVQAIRAAAAAGTRVGIAENLTVCVPAIESSENIRAAQKAMRELNAPFLTVLLEGRYLDSYLSSAGKDAPRYTDRDMSAIGSPLDFVGLNIYTPTYICAADTPAGYARPPRPSSAPRMASSWLYIGPEIAYWAPRHLAEIWKVKEIYITENGCSSDDQIAADGHIYDTDRVMYLRNHLVHANRAVAEGWPLRGYFLWSLMDNFEWTDGYGKRFGIHYVDFKTQRRIPKLSAAYYREVIARNAAV